MLLFGIFISPLTIFLGSYWVFIPLLWKEIHSELRTQIEHLADVNLSLKWNKLERWSTQFLLGRSMDQCNDIIESSPLQFIQYELNMNRRNQVKGRNKVHIKTFRSETYNSNPLKSLKPSFCHFICSMKLGKGAFRPR